MNLSRYIVKKGSGEACYMLGRVSELSNIYISFIFPIERKLYLDKNKGSYFVDQSTLSSFIQNIKIVIDRDETDAISRIADLDMYNEFGVGSEVLFNFRSYVHIGNLLNTYAQMNLPTPILFDPTNLINDYRSLLGSKLKVGEITNKIRKFLSDGKYNDDFTNPLINLAGSKREVQEFLEELEPPKTKSELELQWALYQSDKDALPKAVEDIFINSILTSRGEKITEITEKNEDLSKSFQGLLVALNKSINSKLGQTGGEDEFDFLSEIENIEL